MICLDKKIQKIILFTIAFSLLFTVNISATKKGNGEIIQRKVEPNLILDPAKVPAQGEEIDRLIEYFRNLKKSGIWDTSGSVMDPSSMSYKNALDSASDFYDMSNGVVSHPCLPEAWMKNVDPHRAYWCPSHSQSNCTDKYLTSIKKKVYGSNNVKEINETPGYKEVALRWNPFSSTAIVGLDAWIQQAIKMAGNKESYYNVNLIQTRPGDDTSWEEANPFSGVLGAVCTSKSTSNSGRNSNLCKNASTFAKKYPVKAYAVAAVKATYKGAADYNRSASIPISPDLLLAIGYTETSLFTNTNALRMREYNSLFSEGAYNTTNTAIPYNSLTSAVGGVCKLLSNKYASRSKNALKTLFPDTIVGINTHYAGQTTISEELANPYAWSLSTTRNIVNTITNAGKFDQFIASFRDNCSSNGPGSNKKLSGGLVTNKIKPAKATD